MLRRLQKDHGFTLNRLLIGSDRIKLIFDQTATLVPFKKGSAVQFYQQEIITESKITETKERTIFNNEERLEPFFIKLTKPLEVNQKVYFWKGLTLIIDMTQPNVNFSEFFETNNLKKEDSVIKYIYPR